MRKKNDSDPYKEDSKAVTKTAAMNFCRDIGLVIQVEDFKTILLKRWEEFLISEDKEDRKFALKELSQYVFPKNVRVSGIQEINITIKEMDNESLEFGNITTTEANVIETSDREQ